MLRTLTIRRRGRAIDARRSGKIPLQGLLPLVVGLTAWQLAGDPTSPYFPVPSRWVQSLHPLLDNGELIGGIGSTTWTFLSSLLSATLVGFCLGTFIGSSRLADRALGPSLEFLRTLPASALVPLATLILGYTGQMKMAVVVLPTIWPILLTVRAARRSLSPCLLDVPRTLGLSNRERILKILLPALWPAVLLGLRLAAPLALIITLLVEIVTRINGVGALLGNAQANFDSAQVFGLLAVAGVLGLAVNWVVVRLEARVALRMRGEVVT